MGLNVKFLYSNPEKAHPCSEPRRLTYFAWKSLQGPEVWKNPEKRSRSSKYFWCANSRIRGKETPWGIVSKFCVSVDIHDVRNHVFNFLWRSVKGFGVARGRISRFPIDLRRRPYNTLALYPCECVITQLKLQKNKREGTLITLHYIDILAMCCRLISPSFYFFLQF